MKKFLKYWTEVSLLLFVGAAIYYTRNLTLFIIYLFANLIYWIFYFRHLYTKRTLSFYQYLKKFVPDKAQIKLNKKLISACEWEEFDKVTSLINKNADVNYRKSQKDCPLILACKKGKINILKFFLEKNADIHVKSVEGQNALEIACKKRYFDIADLLLAQVNDSSFLKTLIFSKNTYFIGEILKNKNQGFNYQDPYGKTALMYAVFLDDLSILLFLLENKANPNLKDLNECNALIWAFYAHNLEAVNLILDYGGIWEDEYEEKIAFIDLSLDLIIAGNRLASQLEEKGINTQFLRKKVT